MILTYASQFTAQYSANIIRKEVFFARHSGQKSLWLGIDFVIRFYIIRRKICQAQEHILALLQHDISNNTPLLGNAYLEMKHGLYWLRMITRQGNYNLYLTCLSRAAYEQSAVINTAGEEET